MSGFKKHNFYGIYASSIMFVTMITLGLKTETSLILSLSAYLGSNFPDLDTNSIPSMWAARFAIVSSVYFVYINNPIYSVIVGIIFAAPKVHKHRGWTHKYTTLFSIPVLVYFMFEVYTLIAISFSAGLFFHYLIDRLNPLNLKNWI